MILNIENTRLDTRLKRCSKVHRHVEISMPQLDKWDAMPFEVAFRL